MERTHHLHSKLRVLRIDTIIYYLNLIQNIHLNVQCNLFVDEVNLLNKYCKILKYIRANILNSLTMVN